MLGRVLDARYRIESRIARGGMAAVYRAHDLRLERTVAVKVMHPGMGEDPTFVERFVREARAAARLTHPNVVAVHDQGDDNGTLFLAMEYVPGRTLRDVVREHAPMTPAGAVAQVEPIVQALAAAHRAGVVHRDVKPENVLMAQSAPGEPERPKVADFGLARAVNTATQYTATGVVIGSVSYLAPEVMSTGRVDERVDVYAVGVVLFELLTGRKPHEGESPMQIAYAHVNTDVPSPSSLVAGIPDYVDALVLRACARDVEVRPADASVLLQHLRRVGLALAQGVTSDPELVEDLLPRRQFVPQQPAQDRVPAQAPVEMTTVVGTGASTAAPLDSAPTEHTSVLSAPVSATSNATSNATSSAAGTGTHSYPAETLTPDLGHGGGGGEAVPTFDDHLQALDASRDQRRRRRGGTVALVVALVLALALGAGAWWFGMGRYVETPGVVSLTSTEAVETITAAGMVPVEGEAVFSDEVAAGDVVSTDPGPGEQILRGGEVTYVVSRGPEEYELPDLTGKTLDEASAVLRQFKLDVGEEKENYDESVEKGRIISTAPDAGTVLRAGKAVDLVISKGRKPIKVADQTGKDADKAAASFTKAGLEVKTSKEFSDTVDKGKVIRQTPTSGTLYRGDAVTLVVSDGPEMITVPNLRSSGVADATAKLEALGFKVVTKKATIYLGLQYVAGTNPGGGKKAPKGSTITLEIV